MLVARSRQGDYASNKKHQDAIGTSEHGTATGVLSALQTIPPKETCSPLLNPSLVVNGTQPVVTVG
jgi:hypothetical protein